MRSSPCSSSSSCSVDSTSLTNRLVTVFKKAYELSTLCDIEVCVIHYGADGELKTWPEDRDKVRDMALRYSRLDEARRRKKSVNLCGFLMKKKKNVKTNLKKKAKTNGLKYPISDHYSADQISQLIQSLQQSYSRFQERLRFLEAWKQEAILEDHQSQNLTRPAFQTQSLNPSKFSLFMYNEGDATLSQIPLSALNFNQVPTQFTSYSADAVQESGLKNQLMHQEPYGYDQNSMCMSNITNSNNFQHASCVSSTQDLAALPSELQESGNNYGLNQLMQQELYYGFDQSMCTSDTTNNTNVLDHCLSNTVTDEFSSEFQDPYGNMVGTTSYDVQSDESTLPSLNTIPNSYFLSDNSRFL